MITIPPGVAINMFVFVLSILLEYGMKQYKAGMPFAFVVVVTTVSLAVHNLCHPV